MHIVHAIETLDPASGGPAAVALSLGVAQARLGHRVTMVCYGDARLQQWLDPWWAQLGPEQRLCVEAVTERGAFEKLLASDARRTFARLGTGADVVHVHGVWTSFLIAACDAANAHGCRLVVTPHGMLDPWSLRQRWWKKRLALLLKWKRLLNSAHFVHALNRSEAELLSGLRLRAPFRVFPNGIDAREFLNRPTGSMFRAKYLGGSDRSYVIFLGRLHYKKGLDYLIDAFEWLCRTDSDTDLVIAGPDDGMAAEVQRWVAERGLIRRVHVVGALYGPMKLSALSGAVGFCLPSRQEGFSVAVLEALACAVPVVISEQCHFPEIAESGAGAVVPLSAERIGQALLHMVQDADWRSRAISAGAGLLNAGFHWPTIAQHMLEAYR